MSTGHLCVLFGEMSIKVFCPFLNWVVCLPGVELYSFSSLYILEIKPLSNISLVKMFSHIVGSLFILLMVSLAGQKLFNLR